MSASDAPHARHVWDTDDFLDVVATQGAFLVPRPSTPVWTTAAPDFVNELSWRLQMLHGTQKSRHRKYGTEAANEWLMGHTPTELVQKRAADVEAMLDAWDAPSPPSPSPPDKLESGRLVSQEQANHMRSLRQRLATPSPSDTTSSPSRKRKRGRLSAATRTTADTSEGRDTDVGQAEWPAPKRQATTLMAGAPRRSARILALPQKNYKV